MMAGPNFLTNAFILIFLSFGAYGNIDILDARLSDSPVRSSRETPVWSLPQLLKSEAGLQRLHAEYTSIEGGQRRPWTVAQLPENKEKNRYYEDDLLPFDHSRVILEKLPDDPSSDYINANYMDGQNSEKEYVATQGPLPNTVDDFWRMIWQLNSTKIIMLANVFEHNKKKVEKYWPQGNEKYGDIEVTTVFEHTIPDLQHVIRTFYLKKSGVIHPRIVRHFHFTGWPDLGVPEDRLPVVSILQQARRFDADNKAPIVVHCSGGIGRTGTVILIDSMLQRAKAEAVVDFRKRLDHMRTLRPDVVEKKEQYVFAHQAVSEVFNDAEMAKKLKEVEETYKAMDMEMNVNDLSPPKDLHNALQKMRWHNNIMKVLINEMTERTGSVYSLVPASAAYTQKDRCANLKVSTCICAVP